MIQHDFGEPKNLRSQGEKVLSDQKLAAGQREELLRIVDELKMIAIAPEGDGGAGVGILYRRVEGAESTLLKEVLGKCDEA